MYSDNFKYNINYNTEITLIPGPLSWVAVGERHVQNKDSPFLPLVCHQLSFAKTFTGPYGKNIL